MSGQIEYSESIALKEVLSDGTTLRRTQNTTSLVLDSTSTPTVSMLGVERANLSAGAYTVNLKTILKPGGGSQDLAGLKIQFVKLRVITATAPVVFTDGAANPAGILASAGDGKLELSQGCEATLRFNDDRPDLSVSVKNIDVASADVEAEFEIIVGAGEAAA